MGLYPDRLACINRIGAFYLACCCRPYAAAGSTDCHPGRWRTAGIFSPSYWRIIALAGHGDHCHAHPAVIITAAVVSRRFCRTSSMGIDACHPLKSCRHGCRQLRRRYGHRSALENLDVQKWGGDTGNPHEILRKLMRLKAA
jgi:hypothetical protein